MKKGPPRRRPKPTPRLPPNVAKRVNLDHITKLVDRHVGADIFIMGTGTSLLGFDWTRMNGKITIALNDAIFAKGFVARYHLFSDGNLYEVPKPPRRAGGYKVFDYDPLTEVICHRQQRCNYLRDRKPGWMNRVWQYDPAGVPKQLNRKDNRLYVNRTVATAGICLAWKMGATRIFLLGVDGYKLRWKNEEGETEEVYYHDGSVKPKERRKERYEQLGEKTKVIQTDRHDFWVKQMQDLKKHLQQARAGYNGPFPERGIYNLSAHSIIDAWEKVDVEKALEASGVKRE